MCVARSRLDSPTEAPTLLAAGGFTLRSSIVAPRLPEAGGFSFCGWSPSNPVPSLLASALALSGEGCPA